MNPKDKRILDEHGTPVGSPTPTESEQLGSQFKIELNSAIDRLREVNEHDLKEIGERVYGPQLKFWKRVSLWVGILGVAAIIWGILKVPDIIENRTRRFIEDNLVGTALTNTVDSVLSNRAVPFVNARLSPLSNSVTSLEKQVVQASNRFEQAQESLSQRLEVQDLLVRAKGGSLAAYQELHQLQTNSTLAQSARAAEDEVGFFFSNWAKEPVEFFNTDTVGARVNVPLDSAVGDLFKADASARVVAAYLVGTFGRKNTIEPLVDALVMETNLYAGSRMIRAINDIAGTRFHVLERAYVLEWWKLNKNNTNYRSAYAGILKYPTSAWLMPGPEPAEIINWMNDTIQKEPDALRARCLRGFYYEALGESEKADQDFAEVEKRSSNIQTFYYYRALVLIGRGHTSNTVAFLNRAFQVSPGLARDLKRFISPAIETNASIRWPTNVTVVISKP